MVLGARRTYRCVPAKRNIRTPDRALARAREHGSDRSGVHACRSARILYTRRATHGTSDPKWILRCRSTAKFTFESFVVGSCNQFAHAAAQAVAHYPSRSYNPLLSIRRRRNGQDASDARHRRALIARGQHAVSSTPPANGSRTKLSPASRHGRMPQLRARYRTADVLLIDDIQSLGSKERTQEEFFHTFNELHDAQKQIVISSDCPPQRYHWSGGASALAFRMGSDGGYPAAGSRNENGDPREESRDR